MWLWENSLISLKVSFFICKKRESLERVEINIYFTPVLMHNKHSVNSFNNYAVKFPIPKYELRG